MCKEMKALNLSGGGRLRPSFISRLVSWEMMRPLKPRWALKNTINANH